MRELILLPRRKEPPSQPPQFAVTGALPEEVRPMEVVRPIKPVGGK